MSIDILLPYCLIDFHTHTHTLQSKHINRQKLNRYQDWRLRGHVVLISCGLINKIPSRYSGFYDN